MISRSAETKSTRRWRRWLLLTLLALSVIVGVTIVSRPAPEPVYGGQPLSTWLVQLDEGTPDSRDAAIHAIRELGPETLPALLALLRATPASPWRSSARRLVEQYTSWRFRTPSAQERHQRAVQGFAALGPMAAPALPEITRLLREPATSFAAAEAIVAIGEQPVPRLAAVLDHPELPVRYAAIINLGNLSYDRPAAAQALIPVLESPNERASLLATRALGNLAAAPELVVPALLRHLDDPVPERRHASIQALAAFGRHARVALPALEALKTDPNVQVSVAAEAALRRIRMDQSNHENSTHAVRP